MLVILRTSNRTVVSFCETKCAVPADMLFAVDALSWTRKKTVLLLAGSKMYNIHMHLPTHEQNSVRLPRFVQIDVNAL